MAGVPLQTQNETPTLAHLCSTLFILLPPSVSFLAASPWPSGLAGYKPTILFLLIAMGIIIVGIIALALLVYLFLAMIYPEKF
jgi:K+-transporting ATPase KdpF subunit